jgi:hypothetical protein
MIAANLLVVLMTSVTIISCVFMSSEAYSQENPAKIKILFLAANPLDTNRLQLDEEIRAVTEKIRSAKYRDIELISAWAVRSDDLIQLLNQHNPQIVHFSGHGSEKGEIVLVDNTGKPKPVSIDAIKYLFRTLKNNIRLVVLNACYSKSQAQAIIENIDCAVGMNTSIGDTAAITFAASFYRALGFGVSVQNAFDQGKAALLLESIPEVETPELLCHAGINPSQIFLVAVENPDDIYLPVPAYGLAFKKIVWRNHYLGANGDFLGEVEYSVKNLSNVNIVKLPAHEASWYRWHIPPPKMRTEIYGEGKNAYRIVSKHFNGSEDTRFDIDGKTREVTNYLWQGNINPPLAPQKSLQYGVVIETKGTEKEAFTSDGSFAGMASFFSVDEMSCELYAPKGYRFKKETYFVRDRAGIMKDLMGVSKPEFTDDDRKVIWTVKKPSPNMQYMIKVVIVKAN